MRKIIVLLCAFAAFSLQALQAQTKKVENFSLPDAVSGQQVSLADFGNRKAVVVLFTSNSCPYAKLYEERFASLVKAYEGKGVGFIMINPNDPAESRDDSMEAMKAKAQSRGLGIPYLADKDQQVARQFGASKAPEVFVLTKKPNHYTIAYSGAIDDNPQVAEDVSRQYAKQAIDAVLAGKVINTPYKRPVGCMIKVGN